MEQSKQTDQLGLHILSRLGAKLRDAAEDGRHAEQPPRMQRALVELGRLEPKKQEPQRR